MVKSGLLSSVMEAVRKQNPCSEIYGLLDNPSNWVRQEKDGAFVANLQQFALTPEEIKILNIRLNGHHLVRWIGIGIGAATVSVYLKVFTDPKSKKEIKIDPRDVEYAISRCIAMALNGRCMAIESKLAYELQANARMAYEKDFVR